MCEKDIDIVGLETHDTYIFFVLIKIIQNHCLICIIWYNTNEGWMIP